MSTQQRIIIDDHVMNRPKVDGLFVYGTLMPSRSRTFENFTGLKPTTIDATLPGYKMYNFGYPGIVPTDEDALCKGELILLDSYTPQQVAEIFAPLDSYEGFPWLYVLHQVDVTKADGTIASALVYVYNQLDQDADPVEATFVTQETTKIYAW